MGTRQNTADGKENTAGDCKNAKLLGDEILCGIISELNSLAEILKSKSGEERAAQEQKIGQVALLHQKFTEYRKIVEEVKDQSIQQMRSKIVKLEKELKESKEGIYKTANEKQALEEEFTEKSQNYQGIISMTEISLNLEREMKTFLEKDAEQLKKKLESQNKKTEEIQRELKGEKLKLQNEIYLKQELEAKLKSKTNEHKSTVDSNKVLKDTLNKQSALLQEMLRNLRTTQQKLDFEITTKKDVTNRYETMINKLIQEKENIAKEFSSRNAELDNEIFKNKAIIEQQSKQLEELKQKLDAMEHNLEQPKILKWNVRKKRKKLKVQQLGATVAKQETSQNENQIEKDSLPKENIKLEKQLNQKTEDIAPLKQQLKNKEGELQSMACTQHSNSRGDEMNLLHENCFNSFKKFDENSKK